VTTEGGADFVAPADRIATFDQDGTTWVEQPLYGQGLFALDRLAEMAPDHPEWKETMPFKAVLDGDHAAMGKFSEKDWMEIVVVTHAGMSTADFEALVASWLPNSMNPVLKKPVTDLVYQPMLEVMDYLRANGFRTYIVTGGGQQFVRVYAEDVYGVPTGRVSELAGMVLLWCSSREALSPRRSRILPMSMCACLPPGRSGLQSGRAPR
jgi:hypothetical protein